MLIRKSETNPVRSSEITPESSYANRRQFLCDVGLHGVGLLGLSAMATAARAEQGGGNTVQGLELKKELTSEEDVTSYNNFYEFGTDKSDPKENAQGFRVTPWSVKVEGLVAKPATYALEDLIKPHKLEERIYRHRCVEAWSMVVPWLGFPMADLVKRVQPLGSARYVQFTTLMDAQRMPGQRLPILQWPYVEGLRLDEALNPLAFFVVGVYGKMLPNQNGAPLRHVAPWKYGFKGCKSIVSIKFSETQPRTAWSVANPGEYGFYANVNPQVDHPRWSQARERRIGEFGLRRTLMFNGYAEQVASMYTGLDLSRNY